MQLDLPIPLQATWPIVRDAVDWCNRQAQKHPGLLARMVDGWPVDDALFLVARKAQAAMDKAALSGDESATRAAARAYCEAWRAIFMAAKGMG